MIIRDTGNVIKLSFLTGQPTKMATFVKRMWSFFFVIIKETFFQLLI